MGNEELVTNYIERYICDDKNLNSAILIKGVWGCGKTYFIKNTLSPKLKKILEKKGKQQCYISLNGLSSIKEFMKRIQSVIIKANVVFKSSEPNSNDIDIITGLDSIFDDINLQGWFNVAFGAKKKFDSIVFKKNINNTFFVFDDLERCQIPLKAILGAINDLIEHNGCKCIIVANEDEIKEKDEFAKIKEKFISRTIEFIPDVGAFFKVQRQLFEEQPLGMLREKEWNEFIKTKSSLIGLNLRIIQSTLFTANEIIKVCKQQLLNENEIIKQYVLNKILNDTYKVEEFCKQGNMCPEVKNEEILSIYTLDPTDTFTSTFEVFNFIFRIVYNGEYDENTILNHIGIFIQNIKTKENISPITELKNYYFLEDEDIQIKLDQINSNIKEMSLAQACTFLNFLIPLLELGFKFNEFNNLDQVLEYMLKEIDFYESADSILYDVVENHTVLKGNQQTQFIRAIQKVKIKARKKSIPNDKSINVLLACDDWLKKLQNDMEDKEYNYRHEKKYLSFLNLDILIEKLEQCTNKQLSEFRDLLYRMYRRYNCLETFSNDIESVFEFVEKLKKININKKINKATIGYIIGDLTTSFPKKSDL
ncbi:MAG: P-loop NTPase fold protein [Beduini sp.]|uniref:P-loop NTPase fold protein n=3 Tax=Beduini sp. TaxID=1922300 RepID=UPI003990DC92